MLITWSILNLRMTVKVEIRVKNLYQEKIPILRKGKKWAKQSNSRVIAKVDS